MSPLYSLFSCNEFSALTKDIISDENQIRNNDGNKAFTKASFGLFSFSWVIFWYNAFYFVFAYFKTSWYSANMRIESHDGDKSNVRHSLSLSFTHTHSLSLY